MAVELGPKNIRVVGLAPGAIGETEGFKRLKMDDTVFIIVKIGLDWGLLKFDSFTKSW